MGGYSDPEATWGDQGTEPGTPCLAALRFAELHRPSTSKKPVPGLTVWAGPKPTPLRSPCINQ